MTQRLMRAAGGSVLAAALVLGASSPALAAKAHHRSHARTHAANSSSSGETALTGSTLSSAESAAQTAVPAGTATGASTETDSTLTGAAYEVHVTKSDGSHVKVIEDASFSVLAVQSDAGCAGGGAGGPGGPGH